VIRAAPQLLVVQPSDLGERSRGGLRVGQLPRPHFGEPRRGQPDQRAAARVEHRRPVMHPGHHGHPLALAQPRVDDGRAPHHLPRSGDLAQGEVAGVGPGRAVLAQVHRGVEIGRRDPGMLADLPHRQVVGRRAELLVGGAQGHRHRPGRPGGQRGRLLVLALRPGQQEVLRGRLGGWVPADDSGGDAGHQEGTRQPGSSQLQLPRPRAQAAHESPGAALQRYVSADGRLRITLY
jgi:hypothetical protein